MIDEKKINQNIDKLHTYFDGVLDKYFENGKPIPEYFEEAVCYNCGSSVVSNSFTVNRFAHARCKNCQMVYVNPRFRESIVENLYNEDDYTEFYKIKLIPSIDYRKTVLAEKKYQQINKYFDRPGKVLDIGSGHIPFPLATHLADVTLENHKYGRAGVPFKHVQGKPVFECNVEDTPFEDKQFDFAYCSHVLEHAKNPDKACNELMRIARRGYIETPTKAKDIFLNSAKVSNHKMWVEAVNGLLIFTEYTSEEIEGMQCGILMDMHCAPKTDREKAFSALIYLKPHLVNTMFIWENEFHYDVRKLATNAKKTKIKQTLGEAEEVCDLNVTQFEENSVSLNLREYPQKRRNGLSMIQKEEKNIDQEIRGFLPKKSKKLTFLQIHTFYPQYLKYVHGLSCQYAVNDSTVVNGSHPQFFFSTHTSTPITMVSRAILMGTP